MFRDSIESMPAKDREAALIAKSDALFELACKVQDDLGFLGIFYGDEPLLQAKKKIDDACNAARVVCGRIKHSDKARATILRKVAARDGPVVKQGET
jgi:hypothetical protein